MAYEYNPESGRFEVPNPHRVENYFLGACAGFCLLLALVALLSSRSAYGAQNWPTMAQGLLAAVFLLAAGLDYGIRMMRQLRFFFGRGQPAGLAQELGVDETGVSDAGLKLRDTLRQNAITYPVPTGALNNLLYSLIKDLVFSPPQARVMASALFQTGVGLSFLLACFLLSMAGIRNGAAISWIGLLYFLLASYLVLRPLERGRLRAVDISPRLIVVFVVATVIGPVILAGAVPYNAYAFSGGIPFVTVTLVILVGAGLATLLMLRAVVAQTVHPDSIVVAPFLNTPSMNATPAQLFTELAREMQRRWVSQVPNRVYVRLPPKIQGNQGGFEAHVIEETQPEPQDLEQLSFGRAWALATTRPLLVLDVFATALVACGAGLLTFSALGVGRYGMIASGVALMIVARFAISAGNTLWRRFEFKSKIYWIETAGNFSAASAEIGAALADSVRTKRQVINVENMTLRVWVTEVDSVCFDTGRERTLVSMRGLPDEARQLCEHLAGFCSNLASVIAPTSLADQQRLAQLAAYNRGGAGVQLQLTPPGTAGQQALPTAPPPPAPTTPSAPAVSKARFCTGCGTPASSAQAQFCASCGTRLV